MSQFFLAYWWLLLLVIIIIAIFTRNLIKFLTTVIIFIFIFIVFWQVIIKSGFTQSNQCFTNDLSSSISINERAKLMNPGIERNQYICSESVKSFILLENCLNNSKFSNKLSFTIFSNLPWFKNTMNDVVTTHNQNCPNDRIDTLTY
ncbi:MAG: hypothetical protein H6772_02400 [Pseudomonadales bacterium]|nr:hypothetical protein [Pseudomonadales bacterium]